MALAGDFRIAALGSNGKEAGAKLCKALRVRMRVQYKPSYPDEPEVSPSGPISLDDYIHLKLKPLPEWEVGPSCFQLTTGT